MFKLNTIRLKDEYELMHGESVDWKDWTLGVKDTLELFLREELNLTSDYYDENGESVFHIKTIENLQTLLADDSETI